VQNAAAFLLDGDLIKPSETDAPAQAAAASPPPAKVAAR
jgi:hypothetical protein